MNAKLNNNTNNNNNNNNTNSNNDNNKTDVGEFAPVETTTTTTTITTTTTTIMKPKHVDSRGSSIVLKSGNPYKLNPKYESTSALSIHPRSSLSKFYHEESSKPYSRNRCRSIGFDKDNGLILIENYQRRKSECLYNNGSKPTLKISSPGASPSNSSFDISKVITKRRNSYSLNHIEHLKLNNFKLTVPGYGVINERDNSTRSLNAISAANSEMNLSGKHNNSTSSKYALNVFKKSFGKLFGSRPKFAVSSMELHEDVDLAKAELLNVADSSESHRRSSSNANDSVKVVATKKKRSKSKKCVSLDRNDRHSIRFSPEKKTSLAFDEEHKLNHQK